MHHKSKIFEKDRDRWDEDSQFADLALDCTAQSRSTQLTCVCPDPAALRVFHSSRQHGRKCYGLKVLMDERHLYQGSD